MTGLLLVEDNRRYRDALELVLAARFTVHATARARVALGWLADDTAFEIAVIDLGLPDADGVDLLRALRQARPGLPVVVLTVSDQRDRVLAAIDAGAAGYVLKETAARELIPAIDAALAGEVALSPRAAAHVVAARRDRHAAPAVGSPPILLTNVERRVLEELARGLSYAQIGLVLDISVNTVRSRIRTLFVKLEVTSSTEAISVAARRGLIRLDQQGPDRR